jgi:hypothetical protein
MLVIGCGIVNARNKKSAGIGIVPIWEPHHYK